MDTSYSNFMVNYKYKDRLFRLLFQSRTELLSLYNAIHGTNYDNPDDLEINTIDDVIYMKMKNDISFIIDSYMSLYEHQGSFNPNMPVRGLMYFGKLYSQYIYVHDINLYSSKLQKLPTPQYYVFYNGDKSCPDHMILRLSDAFEKPLDDGSFEWTATMLNVNYGHNKDILDKCQTLSEYSYLIKCIKDSISERSDLKQTITEVIDHCIEQGILSDFLLKHKSEVIEVCLTEYDEKKVMNAIAKEAEEEGHAEGRAEGLAEGRAEGLAEGLAEGQIEGRINAFLEMYHKNLLTMEQLVEFTGKSIEELQKII